jgi:hypothetical protein
MALIEHCERKIKENPQCLPRIARASEPQGKQVSRSTKRENSSLTNSLRAYRMIREDFEDHTGGIHSPNSLIGTPD